MKAVDVFNSKLNTMESALNITVTGNSVADRFERLHDITRDSSVSTKVESYARMMKEVIVNDAINENTEKFDKDMKPFVMDWVFSLLLSGMAHIYPEKNRPKTHHWLPVTYMKPFGIKGNGKTRAMVDGVAFIENNTVDVAVKDVQFAHDRGDGYDLAVEAFFCQIEDGYSNYRDKSDWSMFNVAVASFFISQSVRNPHPQNGFVGKTISKVINALMVSLDAMDTMFAQSVNVRYRLPISPYTPVRVQRLSNGNKVFVLPIFQSKSFVLSEMPLRAEKAVSCTENYRLRVIDDAQRKNGMVFGISSAAVDAILKNA